MLTKFFIVWGMHRAGTSALAAALSAFGIKAQGQVIEADVYNPTGYHESRELVALNDSMLSALNLNWSSLSQIDEHQTSLLEKAGALDAATDFLLRQKGAYTLLKDPRMCKLGLLWQHAFHKLEISPCCLIAWRNPLAVAQSLARRNSSLALNRPVRDTRYGQLLWLSYTTAALNYTRPYRRIIVGYERFIKNPAAVLASIGKFFDLPQAQAAAATDFLSSSLNHFDANSGKILPGAVSKLYEYLESISDLHMKQDTDNIEPWPDNDQEKLLASLLDEESGFCLQKQREILKIKSGETQPCPKASS